MERIVLAVIFSVGAFALVVVWWNGGSNPRD